MRPHVACGLVAVLGLVLSLGLPRASASVNGVECASVITSQSASGTQPVLDLNPTTQIFVGFEENVEGQEGVGILIVPAQCGLSMPTLP